MEKLAGDASTREYFRVFHDSGTEVLCRDSLFLNVSPQDYPFYIMEKRLAERGIPVPAIHFTDEENGLLLLEDGGDIHLQSTYHTMNCHDALSFFQRLIDIMVQIQSTESDGSEVPFGLSFDVEKLMFEFDFFIDHTLLNYFKSKISQNDLKRLRNAFLKISEILHRPELFVLNHRDYHSRNVLVKASEPFILDFQDARMGLPQYDAVSLLRDSYLVLENDIVQSLKDYHHARLKEAEYDKMSRDEYDFFFDIMAFQRNVKALGTFGYQITQRDNRVYEPYIAPTRNYLPDYIERRPELRAAGAILERAMEAAS